MAEPAIKNIPYGPHERNVLDLYLAPAQTPRPLLLYIHGGGFKSGDKAAIHPVLVNGCLQAGISIASINYRYSTHAPYPAPMLDCQRALQLLRYRAAEWNLDPTRIASSGVSAGAGISMWLGFRPDAADPLSPDPIARQSTRLTCLFIWNGQCSYDPHFIRRHISGQAWLQDAMQKLFDVTPDRFDDPRALRDFADSAGLTHVSKDSPPVFIWFVIPDLPMTGDLSTDNGIHHPIFGKILKQRMDELGVECILRLREQNPEWPEAEFKDRLRAEGVEYLKKKFGLS